MTPMASAVPGQCRLRFLGRSASLNGVHDGTSRKTSQQSFLLYRSTCALHNNDQPMLSSSSLHHPSLDKPQMDSKVKQARDLIMVGPSSRRPEYTLREAAQTIDSLQRLGIDHHFPQEIGRLLGLCYEHMITNNIATTDHGAGARSCLDMYEVATAFRLLRQHGYYVSTHVFDRFQDAMGRFKLPLGDDVIGLLALHEASFLGIHGEDDIVLLKAGEFARKHIVARLPTLGSASEKRAVKYALDNPYHLTLPSYSTKFYLENSLLGTSTGGKMDINAPVLYELAKLDFNSQQSMHVEQLRDFSQWWRELGLADQLNFARNQPLKWFTWSIALVHDARFSKWRVELTKPIAFVYLIDDIFDTYGSLDELICFTAAVRRWNIHEIDSLPGYMQMCFSALYKITNEIADKIHKEHGWNPIFLLRKSWAALCDAFLVETKWFRLGHLPQAELYLKNGIVSSGMPVVLLHLLSSLGEGDKIDNIHFHNDMPALMASPATILRLWDDLGSAQDEKQQGYDGSYINCYRKENGNSVPVEEVRGQVMHMIIEEWKKLNAACISPNSFSAAFISGSLNAARMVQIMYSYDEDLRLVSLEQHFGYLLTQSAYDL